MLDLNADDWKTFDGGYKLPYDASVPLRALRREDQPSEDVWDQLWENLYHQGDVGAASYASVPWLVSIHSEKKNGSITTCRILSMQSKMLDRVERTWRFLNGSTMDMSKR